MNQSGTRPRGTELSRFNALRHGILSRYTVLPWEDGAEYAAIVAALTAEHNPQGPTEEHLVEELAGIIGGSAGCDSPRPLCTIEGSRRRCSPFARRQKRLLSTWKAAIPNSLRLQFTRRLKLSMK